MDEIMGIYDEIQELVNKRNGIDYFQVFTDGKGRKLFFVDQLNKPAIESGQYAPEDNYCVLMLAEEY